MYFFNYLNLHIYLLIIIMTLIGLSIKYQYVMVLVCIFIAFFKQAVRVRLNEENNVKCPVDSPSNPSIHVVEYSFNVKKQQEFPVY